MKSILRHLALLPAISLITACGSGIDVRLESSFDDTPEPSNGIQGAAAKGVIAGAAIAVTDAAGAEVALRSGGSTGADGSFEVIFAESAVAAGLLAPLTVTVTGGISICDLDITSTTDDCALADETFVAFGQPFELPETFSLSATLPALPEDRIDADPVATAFVSPASTLATRLALIEAGNSALLPAEASAADAQLLGLIQALTGLDLAGQELIGLPVYDITEIADIPANPTPGELANLGFAIAILAEVDPDDVEADTLEEVMARLLAEMSVDDDGNLVMTGEALARLAGSMLLGLDTVIQQLAAAGRSVPAIAAARDDTAENQAMFAAIDDDPVEIPPATDSNPAIALAQSQQLIGALLVAGPLEGQHQSQSLFTTAGNLFVDTSFTADGLSRVFSDGTARLTIQYDESNTLLGGILAVGTGQAAVPMATIDANGVITYADGSFQLLPAELF